MSNNEKDCPYCNQSMPQELYNDHLMCHQLQMEDNFNAQNNINPIRYDNQNLNRNQNNSNDNNSHFHSNLNTNRNSNNIIHGNDENNENNLLTNIFGLFTSSLQNQNNNNSQANINNSSNRNNNNSNTFDFLSSIIGLNQNNNNNNNSNINRNNNNNQEEGNIFQKLSSGLTNISNTINSFGEIGNQLQNISSNIRNNPLTSNLFRAESLNENNNSSIRNERRINLDNANNAPFISVPFRNNTFRPRPRVIIGGRRIIRNNINDNHNHINSNEVERIMELLPCSILTEKKDGENNECIICLSEFEVGDSITTLPCVHIFHNECIKNWLKNNNHCPICKFEITLNSIIRDN